MPNQLIAGIQALPVGTLVHVPPTLPTYARITAPPVRAPPPEHPGVAFDCPTVNLGLFSFFNRMASKCKGYILEKGTTLESFDQRFEALGRGERTVVLAAPATAYYNQAAGQTTALVSWVLSQTRSCCGLLRIFLHVWSFLLHWTKAQDSPMIHLD